MILFFSDSVFKLELFSWFLNQSWPGNCCQRNQRFFKGDNTSHLIQSQTSSVLPQSKPANHLWIHIIQRFRFWISLANHFPLFWLSNCSHNSGSFLGDYTEYIVLVNLQPEQILFRITPLDESDSESLLTNHSLFLLVRQLQQRQTIIRRWLHLVQTLLSG